MASKVLAKARKRPFLVGGVVMTSLWYLSRRRTRERLSERQIWLDMDLSAPLSKDPRAFDMSFLSSEPEPLYVRDVVDALEMAAKDDKVKGVLGRFSYRSWGQSAALACVQEVRDAVILFRNSGAAGAVKGKQQQQSKKFTIAVADTFGEGGPAVGEYFLASAFEKVLVQKTGLVGLTGTGAQKVFFKGFFDQYGIKPEVFAREEYKSAAESLVKEKYSKAEREAMSSLLTSIMDEVVDGIAASRGFKKRKDVYAIMQDCPLPAKLALSANLIDGIMYEHEVIRMTNRGFHLGPAKAGGVAGAAAAGAADSTVAAADADAATSECAAEPMDNILSIFAGEQGSTPPTRVSMRAYVKKMKQARRDQADQYSQMAAKRQSLDGAAALEGAHEGPAKRVALINVSGTIKRSNDSRVDAKASSSELCKRLQGTIDDPTIAAVVLRVDSPGGSAVASDSIAAAVHRVKAAGKPVVCSMGDVAASGGYMIAAACDTIVAQPTTITGSIGVIAAKLSVQRLLKSWGITVDSIEISENHLAFSPLQDFSPKQRSLMDKRVAEIYKDFVEDVAGGRKLPVEEVYKVAKGRVWTGRQALDKSLVDELGGLNRAIAIARSKAGLPENAPVIDVEPKSLAQLIWSAAMDSDSAASDEVGGDGGVRASSLLLALADSVVGAEAIETLCSAVSVLASANDIAKGKLPRGGRATRGELELDIDDI